MDKNTQQDKRAGKDKAVMQRCEEQRLRGSTK